MDERDFDQPEFESESDAELGANLAHGRAVPSAAFRSALRRSLMTGAGAVRWRRAPASRTVIRAQVAAFTATGAVLLAVAAIGVAGAGPLAA